jgi:hypothetical protein
LTQATGESVVAVHHDGIHQTLAAIREKPIQGRSSLPRAADAFIHVFMSDLQPSAGGPHAFVNETLARTTITEGAPGLAVFETWVNPPLTDVPHSIATFIVMTDRHR